MPLTPFNWNVVVKGAWNRAIFTPNKISQKLFGLDEGTVLQVLVPIDGMSPQRMLHDDIAVSVNSSVLEVAAQKQEYGKLKQGLEVASKALNWLKETPVMAGGYNFRFKVTDREAISVSSIIQSELDTVLSDNNFKIIERNNIRVVEEGSGEIHLITRIDKNSEVTIVVSVHAILARFKVVGTNDGMGRPFRWQ